MTEAAAPLGFPFRRVALVGSGLMGGWLARALKALPRRCFGEGSWS